MATEKDKATAQGVQEAWDFWLSQHPVSVPEMIEAAVKKAFEDWLVAHRKMLEQTFAKMIGEHLAEWLHRNSEKIIAAIAARRASDAAG